FRGGTPVGTAIQTPYSVTVANVASGLYQITAVATDNAGATTTSSAVSVRVNAAPTVNLTKPTNGMSFTAPASIAISANATDADGSVAKVEFFRGDTLITALTAPPYDFTLTSVPRGSYMLTARITDDLGAVTTSDAVNVTVKSGEPQIYY